MDRTGPREYRRWSNGSFRPRLPASFPVIPRWTPLGGFLTCIAALTVPQSIAISQHSGARFVRGRDANEEEALPFRYVARLGQGFRPRRADSVPFRRISGGMRRSAAGPDDRGGRSRPGEPLSQEGRLVGPLRATDAAVEWLRVRDRRRGYRADALRDTVWLVRGRADAASR